jgi:hypothetical protein
MHIIMTTLSKPLVPIWFLEIPCLLGLLSEKTKVHRLKDNYQGILQITYAEYNINLHSAF